MIILCLFFSVILSDSVDRALGKVESLRSLKAELAQKAKNESLDAFGLYLYGTILKRTCEMTSSLQYSDAVNVLVRSLRLFPMNWSAWHELSSLVTDQQNVCGCAELILNRITNTVDTFFAATVNIYCKDSLPKELINRN